MKNKLVIDKKDDKEEYKILFKVETEEEKYIVYTKDELNQDGEIVAYAGKYSLNKGKQILEPIDDLYTLELLDSVLLQVESKMNVEMGE